MFSTLKRLGVVAGLAVAALAVSAPTIAAQAMPQQTPDVDEATLESFAHAYLEVQRINTQLERALAEVDNDVEEAQEVQRRYGQQMTAAIEAEDLEIEEYRSLIQGVNADPAFRERFLEKIEEIQEEDTAGQR